MCNPCYISQLVFMNRCSCSILKLYTGKFTLFQVKNTVLALQYFFLLRKGYMPNLCVLLELCSSQILKFFKKLNTKMSPIERLTITLNLKILSFYVF